MPNDLRSPEFQAAYASALTGEFIPQRELRTRPLPGSIAALIESYLTSAAYISLRPTSKKGYASRIEHLRIQHGHRSVKGLTRERIITGILQTFATKPGAAFATLKMLRILLRHAINIGWLSADPSAGIKRPKISRIRSWTEQEIATYRARWPLGTMQRSAVELFLSTGQRRSDVVRMAWSHISSDNKIAVTQQKTGRKLLIPLHRDALAALAAADRKHIAIFVTAFGKPFTVDGFSQWLRDAIKAARLPLEVQPHGLRKAAGRRMAEAGASANMIMAVLGHVTMSEAQKYCDEADQVGLAEQAVSKLEGHKRNENSQTPSESLGKRAKRKGKSK